MSKVQRIQSPEELGDIAPGLEKHITSAESVVETTQTDPVIKIKKIIATINEAKEYTDRIGRVIRRGLIEIDKLGGHGVLGYSDDSSFLATEFPTYTVAYLKHMRSTGRIEEIIGVPVGTYSVDAIKPLQRFRILKPVGGNVKGVVSQKNVVNQAGVVQVLEAWAIAKSFSEKAEREKPNRQDIRNAIAQMISAGQAVKRYHDNPSWRERYLSLEAEKTKLQTEKVELQNYCSLLEQKISELQNQLTIAC